MLPPDSPRAINRTTRSPRLHLEHRRWLAEMAFRVLLLGAGEINFGSVEGPWNHTLRLEQKLGSRLKVVGLIDPDYERAKFALESKFNGNFGPAYSECKLFQTVESAVQGLPDDMHPHLAIVGAPPFARGTDLPGQDLELQLVRAFPSCALFTEKPVSSGPEDACWRVAAELEGRGTLVGVGYMLRYSKAVQTMKKIIEDHNIAVMGTNARYVMAYEYARKPSWWDKTSSGGPIVEQATHFCDLSRYFGGDVSLASVSAHTVEHDDAPGHLSAKRFDEEPIPPENRLPRLTSATWKYKSGAVGTLTHVIALHGTTYDTEFEVYADGYRLKLVDPYDAPVLYVRRPGAAAEDVYSFTGACFR
ncbi:putative oxidoreductase C terminal-domain-containing protein [Sparassis latifolia]